MQEITIQGKKYLITEWTDMGSCFLRDVLNKLKDGTLFLEDVAECKVCRVGDECTEQFYIIKDNNFFNRHYIKLIDKPKTTADNIVDKITEKYGNINPKTFTQDEWDFVFRIHEFDVELMTDVVSNFND